MKIRFTLLLVCCLCASAAAFAANPQVELMTSMGDITIELYADKSPKTVENFIQYVRAGHYKGTIFHRVIAGFMVQGGGFTPDFTEKPTRTPIVNEASNGMKNGTGTIAMARTSDPNSATAQFFINVVDNPDLDFGSGNPGYAVFGRVIKGMDIVKKIETVPTGAGKPPFRDVPRTPVVIRDAVLLNATPIK
jgi:cyclophilin family peptidyl-prolyl cis-trans isomerase